jgi:hypothetical protein
MKLSETVAIVLDQLMKAKSRRCPRRTFNLHGKGAKLEPNVVSSWDGNKIAD